MAPESVPTMRGPIHSMGSMKWEVHCGEGPEGWDGWRDAVVVGGVSISSLLDHLNDS